MLRKAGRKRKVPVNVLNNFYFFWKIQDPYANSFVIKKIPIDAQMTVKVAGMTKVGIGADGNETLVGMLLQQKIINFSWIFWSLIFNSITLKLYNASHSILDVWQDSRYCKYSSDKERF